MGTLSLCLKMPEKIQKTKNESDHPGLRKHQKPIENLPKSKLAIFHQFLDVFSAQDDWIHFSVFCIFSGILRHKFRVPTRCTLRNFYFWPITLLSFHYFAFFWWKTKFAPPYDRPYCYDQWALINAYSPRLVNVFCSIGTVLSSLSWSFSLYKIDFRPLLLLYLISL